MDIGDERTRRVLMGVTPDRRRLVAAAYVATWARNAIGAYDAKPLPSPEGEDVRFDPKILAQLGIDKVPAEPPWLIDQRNQGLVLLHMVYGDAKDPLAERLDLDRRMVDGVIDRAGVDLGALRALDVPDRRAWSERDAVAAMAEPDLRGPAAACLMFHYGWRPLDLARGDRMVDGRRRDQPVETEEADRPHVQVRALTPDDPIFALGLRPRTTASLRDCGYRRVGDVVGRDAGELRQVPYVAEKSADRILELTAHLADPAPGQDIAEPVRVRVLPFPPMPMEEVRQLLTPYLLAAYGLPAWSKAEAERIVAEYEREIKRLRPIQSAAADVRNQLMRRMTDGNGDDGQAYDGAALVALTHLRSSTVAEILNGNSNAWKFRQRRQSRGAA